MSVQDVLTDISNNTTKVNAEKALTRTGNNTIDQDGFLQLLMTQLKYQDPLKPMDNAEFVSQQAQFTQISELQKLNKTMMSNNQLMQASTLIGKEVTLTDPENPASTVTGTVSEARMTDKDTNIVVNNKEYPINSIKSIKEAI